MTSTSTKSTPSSASLFIPLLAQWTISVAKNGKKLGLTLVHEGKDSMGPQFAEVHVG
jgi:hypothetical protein